MAGKLPQSVHFGRYTQGRRNHSASYAPYKGASEGDAEKVYRAFNNKEIQLPPKQNVNVNRFSIVPRKDKTY